MHEKDIELTRLLLKEHKDRLGKAASLLEELSSAKEELDSVLDVRKQREGIHDVLSRAAALLEREDLGVDLPESADMEKHVSEMEGQLKGIQAEVAKYESLLEELKEKAPELLKLAQDEEEQANGSKPDSQAKEKKQNPKEAPPAVGEDGGGPEDEMTPVEPDADREPAHATLSKLNKRERKRLLSGFKVKSLTEKEAYAHGRGAVYLVDTKSIFGQIKSYDYANPKAKHDELRSLLALQFYGLSLELSGTFHMVFDAEFPDKDNFGNQVVVDSIDGDAAEYAKAMRELVGSYSGRLRTVCLVTGDHALATSVDGQGAHIIPLDDFFV